MRESVIVTGAARGLGRVVSEVLLNANYYVIMMDSDEKALEQALLELSKNADSLKCLKLDVSNLSECESTFEKVLCEATAPVHLVNNAGITRDGMMYKLTEDQFDRVLEVNLKGVHNCGQQFVKNMEIKGLKGSIVNITSVAYMGNIGQSNYAASKAGVVALTKTWAMELARRGIRVNAVAPGLMNTAMIKSIPDKVMNKLIDKVPLGRVGEPREFAEMIKFLVSDQSSYLTGQVIHLDGGLTIGSI